MGPMEDSRKPEVRDLLEFGTPGTSGWGPTGWKDGATWGLVPGTGWVGWIGLVGKNAWCSGCLFSVEVVKLVFSQVAFVFLMFGSVCFLMFFGHLFRVCWSLFFQPKKSPEKDDLKFRHQNVGEF